MNDLETKALSPDLVEAESEGEVIGLLTECSPLEQPEMLEILQGS
jgi:hypothetical protein